MPDVTWRSSLLLALASCGWSGPAADPSGEAPAQPEAPQTARRVLSEASPHVVVVTLDTTRADRLGAWGYAKARTETLDALAAKGVRFSRAYSPLPLTIPSHATMFTGLYPPRHGIRSNGGGMVEPELTLLSERLQEAGWHTAASVSAFVTTRQWGFDQGFDAYFDEIPSNEDNFWHGERRAELVIDDALGWLAEQPKGEPVYLWVHLYDAHYPFAPPEGYTDPEDFRPYDGEIAYVDDQVQRLVDAFDGQPTVFALVGDHGEGLGDHGELAHSLFVYDATQHVPFVLSGPGFEPAVVEEPVSIADLTPTLLHRLALPVPEGLDGQVRPGHADTPVYMESWQLAQRFALAPHLGLVKGRWKLIATPQPELYDVLADPSESSDVAAAHGDVVRELEGLLDGMGFEPPKPEGASSDPEVAAQLAALGYVDGEQEVDLTGDLPDPKEHRRLIALYQQADRRQMMHDMQGAEEALRSLVAEYPKVIEFHTRLAGLLGRAGRTEEAAAAVQAAMEQAPDNMQLMSLRAGQLAAKGDFDEASDLFVRVAFDKPYTPRSRAMAIAALRRAGRVDEAEKLGRDWMAQYPDDDHLAGVLGVLLVELRHWDEALVLLRQGMEADKPEAEVAWYLAAHEVGQGDLVQALTYLRSELEHHPQHLRSAVVTARVAMRQQAWDTQLAAAQAVLDGNPNDTEMWHAKVLALFNLERYPEAREAVAAGLAVDPVHPELMLMDANLLAKEGRRDEGQARFVQAQDALRRKLEAKGAQGTLAEEVGAPDVKGGVDLDPANLPVWEGGVPFPQHP